MGATRRVWEQTSIGVAAQVGGYDVENTTDSDFIYLEASMAAPPKRERKIHDFSPAVSQVGGNSARLPGSKHGGSFSLRFPVRSASVSYDGGAGAGGSDVFGSTDAIISPEMLLLGWALGSGGDANIVAATDWRKGKHLACSAGVANDVGAGSTTTEITVADATKYAAGQMLLAMTGTSDTDPCVGWISDASAGTKVTLSEGVETAEIPANGDETFDTATAYLSGEDRIPLTFRVLGDNAKFKGVYVGCMPTKITMQWGGGDLLWVELELEHTDRLQYTSGGGLQTATKYVPVPAMLGDDGGRMIVGAHGSATEAEALGWCEMEMVIDWPSVAICDVNAAQGIGEVRSGKPEIKITAKIPVSSDDTITDGEDPWESMLTAGDRIILQASSGLAAGSVGSIYFGALQLAEMPQRDLVDGLEVYSLTLEPGEMSSDTGSTDPANSLVRVGVA